MNRDGYRSGRDVAEHEAAHAVIATLSGCVVHKVSIAPSQADRGEWLGRVDCCPPEVPWPVPLARNAEVDTAAAGLAWELLEIQEQLVIEAAAGRRPSDMSWWRLREAWQVSRGDRREFSRLQFLLALVRVRRTLKRTEIGAAVTDVADAIQARKSGEIYGTTVDKIVGLHVPALAHQLATFTGWMHEVGTASAASAAGLTADTGMTADGAR